MRQPITISPRANTFQYGQAAFSEYIARNGSRSNRKDLLTKILTPISEDSPMTDAETHAEICNLVFAGTDTTSTALTYLFWELAQHQDWQDRLRVELTESSATSKYHTLEDLPILDALISESMRLHQQVYNESSLPVVVNYAATLFLPRPSYPSNATQHREVRKSFMIRTSFFRIDGSRRYQKR
jgi:cytochrome P450